MSETRDNWFYKDGKLIEHGQEEKVEYVDEDTYWLIGIDGTKTPDPKYWFDRWEVVKAKFPGQALTKYAKMKEGWLRPEEAQYVQIWDNKPEYFTPWSWMDTNVVWGPGKYDARLTAKPLEAGK